MRTLSGQETAVLNAADGYSVRARVKVWDGAAYVDVTSLEGRDWLVEVAWDESVNEPCAQATVQLRRRQEDLSLNPLVSNKLTGTLALARAFYIETATIPLGDPPESSDWREVFRGQIESLDLDKDPITFVGRDDAGKILRHFIEFDAEYGSTGGTAIQTVMQSILTDNGWGAVTLYTPVSPGVVLGKFKQKRMSTFLGLRERALSIGWDVRYFWDNSTSAFRLTLRQPDRTGALGSQWTFQPGKVRGVTRLRQTLSDVRNAGRLYYYNRSATDSGGKPTRTYVDASDATSITAYGRLWMQLSEDENSPVDSPTEAQAMLDAAIADMKNPLIDFGVEVGFFYAVQLGDMLTFAADDDERFSSDQTLAVVSAAHRIGRKGHRTSLTLRGLPVGAHDDWLRRESRARPQPTAVVPDTLSGMQATPTASGAIVSFTAPTVPPFPVEYELHVSTSSGFTPSSSTLRERAARTNFEVTGLSPATTYYAKVVPRDAAGNQGAASAQVSIAPRYVEPRVLLPSVSDSALPRNGSFEAHSDSAAPPDAFTATPTSAWGTIITATTTAANIYSGQRAVAFSTGTATLESQMFTCVPGDLFIVSSYVRAASGTATGVLRVRFYKGDLTTSSTVDIAISASTIYGRIFDAIPSDANARYCGVSVVRVSGDTGTLYVDGIDVLRTVDPGTWWDVDPVGESGTYGVFQNDWAVYNPSTEVPVSFRTNDLGRVELRGSILSPTPAPAANANVFRIAYFPAQTVRWYLAASTGTVSVTIGTDGWLKVNSILANTAISLNSLCYYTS